MRRCDFCQAELPMRSGNGRPAQYCSASCRNKAVRTSPLLKAQLTSDQIRRLRSDYQDGTPFSVLVARARIHKDKLRVILRGES